MDKKFIYRIVGFTLFNTQIEFKDRIIFRNYFE